ncbi:MAG: hypothetical protein VW378_02905 [bacterium]
MSTSPRAKAPQSPYISPQELELLLSGLPKVSNNVTTPRAFSPPATPPEQVNFSDDGSTSESDGSISPASHRSNSPQFPLDLDPVGAPRPDTVSTSETHSPLPPPEHTEVQYLARIRSEVETYTSKVDLKVQGFMSQLKKLQTYFVATDENKAFLREQFKIGNTSPLTYEDLSTELKRAISRHNPKAETSEENELYFLLFLEFNQHVFLPKLGHGLWALDCSDESGEYIHPGSEQGAFQQVYALASDYVDKLRILSSPSLDDLLAQIDKVLPKSHFPPEFTSHIQDFFSTLFPPNNDSTRSVRKVCLQAYRDLFQNGAEETRPYLPNATEDSLNLCRNTVVKLSAAAPVLLHLLDFWSPFLPDYLSMHPLGTHYVPDSVTIMKKPPANLQKEFKAACEGITAQNSVFDIPKLYAAVNGESPMLDPCKDYVIVVLDVLKDQGYAEVAEEFWEFLVWNGKLRNYADQTQRTEVWDANQAGKLSLEARSLIKQLQSTSDERFNAQMKANMATVNKLKSSEDPLAKGLYHLMTLFRSAASNMTSAYEKEQEKGTL